MLTEKIDDILNEYQHQINDQLSCRIIECVTNIATIGNKGKLDSLHATPPSSETKQEHHKGANCL